MPFSQEIDRKRMKVPLRDKNAVVYRGGGTEEIRSTGERPRRRREFIIV
jgi:hypothetical protein